MFSLSKKRDDSFASDVPLKNFLHLLFLSTVFFSPNGIDFY